jgi:hypothetical protein
LYHCYSDEPVAFVCVLGIINEIGALLDATGSPASAVELRKFRKRGSSVFERREAEMKTSPQEVISQKGEKGTFVVRVLHRQNATWQGSVTWAERNATQNFRSALELLKLMDGAFADSASGLDACDLDHDELELDDGED